MWLRTYTGGIMARRTTMTNEKKAKQLEKARAWKAANPEKVKAASAAYYAKNKDREREANRKWLERNQEGLSVRKSEWNRIYTEKHKEELKTKRATPE
jgi:hypothetical protein